MTQTNSRPSVAEQHSGASAVFDVSHDQAQFPLLETIRRIALETSATPIQVAQDFMNLAFGPGRLSFNDYVNYRLFDDAFLQGADKTAFIGQRRNLELVTKINYRHDWFGVLTNKIAIASYLAAFGLPIIPSKAIFARGFARRTESVVSSRDDLRRFLIRPDVYPLFGKPVESFQSLGSMALLGYDAKREELLLPGDKRVKLDSALDDIALHYADGYVFQDLLKPHSKLIPAIGSALATARILTISTPDGPKVLRAGWKIPARGNAADNYWRKGNLLAGIDLATGQVTHVTSGLGFAAEMITHHPDTGADLIGLAIPDWDEMKAVAIEGAQALRHLGVIGWDMASTDRGPTIVEANATPDFILVQFAERRGILDEELLELIERQQRNEKAHLKGIKRDAAKL